MKNKDEIVSKASKALNRVGTHQELDKLLREIPEFIKGKSQNFGNVSDILVKHLLQEPINSAKERLGVDFDPFVPKNAAELNHEIKRIAQKGVNEQQLRELKIIEGAISKLNFGKCLEFYSRYCEKHSAMEAVQG